MEILLPTFRFQIGGGVVGGVGGGRGDKSGIHGECHLHCIFRVHVQESRLSYPLLQTGQNA